jgi:hypothetical protein
MPSILLFCCIRISIPWTLIPNKSKNDAYGLHYQQEPVPGIYLISPAGRYLIAIKPHVMMMQDKIFKTGIGLTEEEVQVYGLEDSRNASLVDHQCEFVIPKLNFD